MQDRVNMIWCYVERKPQQRGGGLPVMLSSS